MGHIFINLFINYFTFLTCRFVLVAVFKSRLYALETLSVEDHGLFYILLLREDMLLGFLLSPLKKPVDLPKQDKLNKVFMKIDVSVCWL